MTRMSLTDIEERANLVHQKMNKILTEMADGLEGNEDRAIELSKELTTLIQESKTLQKNLDVFREMFEQLVTAKCSGPH